MIFFSSPREKKKKTTGNTGKKSFFNLLSSEKIGQLCFPLHFKMRKGGPDLKFQQVGLGSRNAPRWHLELRKVLRILLSTDQIAQCSEPCRHMCMYSWSHYDISKQYFFPSTFEEKHKCEREEQWVLWKISSTRCV